MSAPVAGASELDRLERDGLLERAGDRWRTTRRWKAAMMRAAARLVATPGAPEDLRVPVAMVLVEHYGHLGDEEVARLVIAMTELEAGELGLLRATGDRPRADPA